MGESNVGRILVSRSERWAKTNWEGLAYCFKAISLFLVGLGEASTLFREGIEMLVFSFLKK